jgi:hypothetical protein
MAKKGGNERKRRRKRIKGQRERATGNRKGERRSLTEELA